MLTGAWKIDSRSVERIVAVSVVKILLQIPANLHLAPGRNGNVSLIEQVMEICSKKDPVCRNAGAALRIRQDMCGFQCWKRVFSRYGTPPLVSLAYGNSEDPLARSACNQSGRTWIKVKARALVDT
jgi:hypothetical protein